MDFKTLKKRLAAEAAAKGICAEWHTFILKAETKAQLVTLFVKGIDFCLANDYPCAELRREFENTRRGFGIYINDPVSTHSQRRVIAFGNSHGTADYDGYDVGEVIATNDTQLTITALGNAFVSVDMSERSDITIKASGSARVSVFRHGGSVIVDERDAAKVTITNKEN